MQRGILHLLPGMTTGLQGSIDDVVWNCRLRGTWAE
jgi:hypothetical protein